MNRIRAEVLLLTSLTPYRWAKAAHVVAVGLCGFVLLLCACDRENKETVARPAMRLQYSAISFWSTVVLFIYFLPFFSFFSSFFSSFFLFFFLSFCCRLFDIILSLFDFSLLLLVLLLYNFIKFKYSSFSSQFNNL